MTTTTDESTAVQTIRLLVVEDDDAIRNGYPPLCEFRGWDCLTAASVAEAEQRIVGETDLSACVLDLRLGQQPDGGLAVLEAFQRKFPDAPVVLLTGGGSSVEKAVCRGAAMVVRKPASADHMLTVVEGLLETRRVMGDPAGQLERQLDQLERYINALGVGVVILDRRGVIRLLNYTMTNEVGVPPAAVGQEWVDVMGGQYFGDLKVSLREDFPQTNEVTYCGRHYLVTTRVCEEPTGSDFLLIQTWLDITKRKKAVDLLGRLPSLATQPPLILANELVKEVCGIGYPRAYLYIRDPDREGTPFGCLAAFADGLAQDQLRGEELPPDDPFLKKAEADKRVILLDQEDVDFLLKSARPESRRTLNGVTGMLKVPLFLNNKLVAILCIETVGGAFATEDEQLMELLSRGLSDALAASLQIPAAIAQARWAWPARAINLTLSDGGEVTAVLHEVLSHTAAALNADYAWLLLRDESSADDALTLRAQWTNRRLSLDIDRLRQFRHSGVVGVTGRALRTRHLQVVPDLWTDDDYLAYFATIRSQSWLEEPSRQLRSTVVMPVFRGAEPVGVVGLFFMEQFQPDPVDEEHLRVVSRLVAVALRRMGDTAAIIAQAAQHAKIADLMLLGSGVAHALRNQLSEIRTSLELAEREPNLVKTVARVREGLAAERRLSERLEQLIEWSKPEGMQPGEVSLADTVNAIHGLIDDRLRSSGVEFVPAFDPATPPVYGPRDAFKMAVLDLFVNAVTALDKVTTGPKRITATLRPCPESGRAELRITDTGPGVPVDQMKVFEQFDTPGGPPPGGIGLGLYLAHRFVTAAGGTIAFRSEPAGGTSVILTLPIACGGPQ